ncbi:hypothetical protein Gotri_016265, partial [Gossypium trilobum]|nr:hypothetical protein [Gossypium trilobum]
YADLLLRSSTDRTGRLFRYDPRNKKGICNVQRFNVSEWGIPDNIKMNDKGEFWVRN